MKFQKELFIYTVETQPYIEALPADDPRVVQDEAERVEAQAVIDANSPECYRYDK